MGISPTAERPVIATGPSVLRRRARQRFGRRIQWETAFFGLLAAVGLGALLVAMLIGGLVAAGVTDFDRTAASLFHHLLTAGGAIAVAILALSFLTGGYVAARMARFDGWRQGLGVWLLSAVLVLAVVIAAWISGGELDPSRSISLPADPIDGGPLGAGRGVVIAVLAVVPLLAAIAGGVLGERYHRAVDEAAFEPYEPDADEPSPGDEGQPYGPDRVRQEAPASAASSSEVSTDSPAASP
jgi:hypothetical protein